MAGSTSPGNAESSLGHRGCHWLQLMGLERRYFKHGVWASLSSKVPSEVDDKVSPAVHWMCRDRLLRSKAQESRGDLHPYLKEKVTLEP